MNHWDPQIIAGILIKSSKIAVSALSSINKEIKEDKSIVTRADREIESYLSTFFDKPSEGSYIIGEETLYQKSSKYIEEALNSTAWIVDPIDGTVPYANGLPFWGISIGYAEQGIIREGAIYFPAINEIYITDNGKVFTSALSPHAETPVSFADFKELKPKSGGLNAYDIVVLTQSYAKYGKINIPNPVLVLCCATASFTFTASGKFMAYVGSNIKLWDYAASIAILKNLNFKTTFFDKSNMSLEITKNHLKNQDGSLNMAIRNKVIVAKNDEIIEYIITASS